MASTKEDINSALILTIGAISAVLVIVVVIGLQAWYLFEEGRETDEKYANAVNTRLVEHRAKEQTNITTYRWLEGKKNQQAAIPINVAMELTIANKGKVPTTQPK